MSAKLDQQPPSQLFSPELVSIALVNPYSITDEKLTSPTETTALQEYLSDFANNHPDVYLAWDKGGLLHNREAWNIIAHQIQGAIYADILAEYTGVHPLSRQKVVRAYMIHDVDKLNEIKELDRVLASDKKSSARRQEAEKRLKRSAQYKHDLLAPLGLFSEDEIYLSGVVVPSSSRRWFDLPAEIIHFVDACLDGTKIKTPQDRFAHSSGFGGNRQRRNTLAHQAHASILDIDNYPALQISLAEQEAYRFIADIQRLHPEYTGTLHTISDLISFLDNRLADRVHAFSQSQYEA